MLLGGPSSPRSRFWIEAYCTGGQIASGPLTGTVRVDGQEVGKLRITRCDPSVAVSFPLPDNSPGKESLEVQVELDRTFRVPGDNRDLGLSFGKFEIR